MAREIESTDDVKRVLEDATTIAVLGAHPSASRPAAYVPAYLREVGYRVIPVNPRFVGQVLFGEQVRASLAELHEAVDIVDVFRRSEDIPGHLDDILSMSPRPRLVWFQLGITNDDVARRLIDEGIDVVQDRCTLADHRRLGLPRRG